MPKLGVKQIVEHNLWKIYVMITLVLNLLQLVAVDSLISLSEQRIRSLKYDNEIEGSS